MSQRLPRRIGVTRAKLMMMTARSIDATEAKAIGLIDEVASEGALGETVGRLASELISNSWFTNAENKRLVMDADGMSLAEGLAHEHFRHSGRAPDWLVRVSRFRGG